MDIAALRSEIDRVDVELLALLDERIELAAQIADAKVKADLPLHDREREDAMLKEARTATFNALAPHEAEEFLATVLTLTRTWITRRRRAAHVQPLRIAIVGLGLIGGSIAKALKRANPDHRLVGIDLSDRLLLPSESGLFTELYSPEDGAKGLAKTDVVFVCTHVEKTIELLPTLADDAPVGCTVTDVSGIKTSVVESAVQAFDSPSAPHFVGGHPMAGKAQGGFENSEANLFEGRAWILTPTPHDPVDKMRRLSLLIESIGARVELLSADEHDRTMAVVSHLPQLVSVAMMLTAGGRHRGVAGNGLRDMTRLADSPAGMWNRLISRMRPEVLGELQRMQSYLTDLEMAVGFGEPLDKWFELANAARIGLDTQTEQDA